MKKTLFIYLVLVICLFLSIGLSLSSGAIDFTLTDIFTAFSHYWNGERLSLNEKIFIQIRVPRTVLSILVGGILALGGTLLQALFRNPIVEPGMIGTTNGAAAGSALFFVIGGEWLAVLNEWVLPSMAFLGGLIATVIVVLLAKNKQGKSNVLYLLLIGIAINAICLSAVGLMSYWARDPQARSITFWSLGTLSGATWKNVTFILFVAVTGLILSLKLAKKLDTLMLGETEANYLGVNIKSIRFQVIFVNVLLVSIATAFTGVISFVGLIVPHLLRILNTSHHRYLIIGSILLGGTLLCLSDWVCRVLIAPAELPISIVTSIIGVPIFIFLLKQKNYFF